MVRARRACFLRDATAARAALASIDFYKGGIGWAKRRRFHGRRSVRWSVRRPVSGEETLSPSEALLRGLDLRGLEGRRSPAQWQPLQPRILQEPCPGCTANARADAGLP